MKKLISLLLATILIFVFIAGISVSAKDSYVEDGLVAFYDAGQQAAGTTWADLSGNGYDITDLVNTGGSGFADGAYLSKHIKNNFPSEIAALISSGEFTTEIQIGDWTQIGSGYSPFLNCINDQYSLFYNVNSRALVLKNTTNTRPTVDEVQSLLANSTITVTFKAGGTTTIYINGEEVATAETAIAIQTEDFYFGHGGGESPTAEEALRQHDTEYIKIRFYDRVLSAGEVKQNFDADAAGVVFGGTEDPVSSQEPSSTVESSNETTSSAATTETGDNGYIAIAIIALVTLAAVVVVKKSR